MSANADGMLIARSRLCGQIDALASNLNALSPAQLALSVDAIRATACDNGMVAVAELAAGWEKALAGSLSMMFAPPFLAAMRDATECEPADEQIAQTFLAVINQRLYGCA